MDHSENQNIPIGEQSITTDTNHSLTDVNPADLISNADAMLAECHVDLSRMDAVKLPVESLATLGGSMASMLPAFRQITETIKVSGGDNLYRCVFPSHGAGGHLANFKDGSGNLGTIMSNKGIIAQARWVKEDGQTFNISSKMPIDPTSVMMGAALAAIEKKLDTIIETEQKILSFLQEKEESKIEGDLKTLTTIIKEYKYNWDSELYTSTHHSLAAEIKRTSEGNLIFYQKQIADLLKKNQIVITQQFINAQSSELKKAFQYYRMSLYVYAFASFLEVMLQKNYTQAYVDQVKQNILERSDRYHEVYDSCYAKLDSLTNSSIEKGLLKGLGTAGKGLGKSLGNIGFIKDRNVDEWLGEKSAALSKTGENLGQKELLLFEDNKESGAYVFVDQLSEVNKVFNQTTEFYMDQDNIYLVTE